VIIVTVRDSNEFSTPIPLVSSTVPCTGLLHRTIAPSAGLRKMLFILFIFPFIFSRFPLSGSVKKPNTFPDKVVGFPSVSILAYPPQILKYGAFSRRKNAGKTPEKRIFSLRPE
jgi:hypothetical protein